VPGAFAERYDRTVSRTAALVDEIATELDSWPGVRIERRSQDLAVVRYEQFELGVLDRDRGEVELRFAPPERDELVEHGDAEPAEPTLASENVSHPIHGPADVTAVLELFDRRYRDLRGEDDPYSSQDPG
jgi:luciferase-like monooxygenase